jgi:hypothetical protein
MSMVKPPSPEIEITCRFGNAVDSFDAGRCERLCERVCDGLAHGTPPGWLVDKVQGLGRCGQLVAEFWMGQRDRRVRALSRSADPGATPIRCAFRIAVRFPHVFMLRRE